MSFLWNFFSSPSKDQEQEQEKVDSKKDVDINSFNFNDNFPKKKNQVLKENKNLINEFIDPFEEIQKQEPIKNKDDIFVIEPIEEIKKDDIKKNNIKKKEELDEPKEEIIKDIIKPENENLNEKKNIIQNSDNNNNTQHEIKKIKKKKGKKKEKKEEENKTLSLEITNDNSKSLLIMNKSESLQKNNQIIVEPKVQEENIKNINIILESPENNKNIILEGPENSPYQNGKFELSINYDNKDDLKPILKFITKIYHYNISQSDGEILCPYIWNKKNNEEENIKNIKTLLLRPDTRFPCSKFIKDEYYNNYQSYIEKAQNFTENYAMN